MGVMPILALLLFFLIPLLDWKRKRRAERKVNVEGLSWNIGEVEEPRLALHCIGGGTIWDASSGFRWSWQTFFGESRPFIECWLRSRVQAWMIQVQIPAQSQSFLGGLGPVTISQPHLPCWVIARTKGGEELYTPP